MGLATVIPGTIVSYAQNFEDVLLWRVLREVQDGFYIDIGAQDPVADSVSLGFYEQGWRGIHVEPSPEFAELLRRGRPDETVVQAAVSDESGLITFYAVPKTGMSTAVSELADFAAANGQSVQKIVVPAITLDDILALADARSVHWMKIDVEGMESQVLKGWRKSVVRPWIVLLESITPWRVNSHQSWEPFLFEKGYEFVYFDGLNRYYVLASRPDLKEHLGYGPSFWDAFHVPHNSRLLCHETLQLQQRTDSLGFELQQLTRQREGLESALETSRTLASAAESEAARLREEREALSQALDEARALLAAREKQSEDAVAKLRADLDFAHAELNRARNGAAELQQHLDDLKLQSLQTAVELEEARSTFAERSARLGESERRAEGLQAQLRALQQETWSIRSEVQARRSEAAALRSGYGGMLRNAEQLAAENELLRRALTQVHGVIEQACSSMAVLHAETAFLIEANPSGVPASQGEQPADSLETLLTYHDEEFVRNAYLSLFRRPADAEGLQHILQALRSGHSRLWVLEQMQLSEEGKLVDARLPGLEEALELRKREQSWRARLSRVIGARTSTEAEMEALVARVREQLPGLARAHKAAAAQVSGLNSAVQQIARILGRPLDPALAAPARIVTAAEPSSERQASVEAELESVLLRIGAKTGGQADEPQVAAVVGVPDVPLDADISPAVLIAHDWDESGYPTTWTDALNSRYSAVGCSSMHTRKILIDHGVEIPATALGLGVDHWDRVVDAGLPALQGNRFRFVHVARDAVMDGTDLALESFARVFSQEDDVCLVVACTAEVEPELRSKVALLRKAEVALPEVVLAVGRWSDAELKSLFHQCDVLLSPARACGFALDTALAIRSGLDVVATRWGGHLDFCADDNAWLVDFEFGLSTSDRQLIDSTWARVTDAALDAALRSAFASTPEARAQRNRFGQQRLKESFSWNSVGSRFMQLLRDARDRQPLTRRRIGWVTTWNTKCGIAGAASHMADTFPEDDVIIFAAIDEALLGPDKPNCRRTWYARKQQNDLDRIVAELGHWSVGALIIHFNYGFFNHAELERFIDRVTQSGVVVILHLHSTVDPVGDDSNYRLDSMLAGLRKCHRILAHTPGDLNRLKALGLVDNVVLFPHGVMKRGYMPEGLRLLTSNAPLLATFGFCLPNKGLPELVEAVSILREQGQVVRLRMLNARHPNPVSSEEVDRVRAAIEQYGLGDQIEFRTEYLDDDTCLQLLHQADLIVNPYQSTAESASGAVRFGLSAGRPVAVTPIPIFDDLGGAVFRFPGTLPAEMAEGISMCLEHMRNGTAECHAVLAAEREWLNAHDYQRQGQRLGRMIRTLQHECATAQRAMRD